MDIRRFYASSNDLINDQINIDGEEYDHIVKVMRYKVGFKLIVCVGDGYDYHCIIESISKEEVVCKILEKSFNDRELDLRITLLLGLIKPEKMDIAIQKAVELGVSRIIPVICEYTSEYAFKLDRAKRIIVESCKQCGRAVVPEICQPMLFEQAVSIDDQTKLMAYEKEKGLSALNAFKKINKSVSVLIGSEGGFSQKEVETAIQMGFTPFSLGKRILRTETAVISTLGAMIVLLEE